MKANLFFAGLCALALAETACSVDETPQTNDANAISFKATAPYASRAAAVTTNSLNSFTVWGWTESETVMDHATATRESGGSVYSTSLTYYWPGAAVDFLALTPAADADLYDSETGTSYIGGEFNDLIDDGRGTIVTHTGHVAEAMVDHAEGFCSVHVYVPSDSKGQIDLCYASTPNKSSGTVAMNFRHALAQITFAARTTNAEQEIRIKGVKVCSVRNWGVFEFALPLASTETNLPTDDLGTDGISDSQGEWDLAPVYKGTQFSAGLDLGSDEYITVPTDNTPVTLSASDGSLFLLPQEVKGWDPSADPTLESVGAYFRVECAIIDSDGSLVWPNEEERNGDESMEYAEIAVPADVVWDEGYKYTYTFVFGEGAGYYPPDDGVCPGEEIPFTPIRFDVSAGEFQPTDETDVEVEPAPVPIDYFDYIIDEDFLEYMQQFDKNEDGHLYYDELEFIVEIDCTDCAATDFTGIEYYYNLESFTSHKAACTSKTFEADNDEGVLDLSNNTRLSYVYLSQSTFESVNLKNTNLVNLRESAFQQCEKMAAIYLPECLETIGDQAISYSYALTSIELPEGLTSIGKSAFYGSGLEAIEIPDSVSSIGDHAFAYCYSLVSAKLPKAVKLIDELTFYYCSSLESVTFATDGELEEIGQWAFGWCEKLASVAIPNSVKAIDAYGFYNDHEMTAATLSSNLTKLGDHSFSYCKSLTAVVIPDGVTELEENVFSTCYALASVTLPDGLLTIGKGSFASCFALKTITIPSGVTSLGDYSFYGCQVLQSFVIPDGVTEIKPWTFAYCMQMSSVTLPPELTTIGEYAFTNCYMISSYDIPATIETIGEEAFSYPFQLNAMTIRAVTPPTLKGTNTFYNLRSGAVLHVPSESVGAYSEAGWEDYFTGGIEAITD